MKTYDVNLQFIVDFNLIDVNPVKKPPEVPEQIVAELNKEKTIMTITPVDEENSRRHYLLSALVESDYIITAGQKLLNQFSHIPGIEFIAFHSNLYND